MIVAAVPDGDARSEARSSRRWRAASSVCLFLSLVLTGLVSAQSAGASDTFDVMAGEMKTFTLASTAGALRPSGLRVLPIGPANPAPLEISIGVAAAGNAVGFVKLHVFERSARTVDFEASAYRGTTLLAREHVCGRRDMDAWVAFPAETTRVVLTDFMEVRKECR